MLSRRLTEVIWVVNCVDNGGDWIMLEVLAMVAGRATSVVRATRAPGRTVRGGCSRDSPLAAESRMSETLMSMDASTMELGGAHPDETSRRHGHLDRETILEHSREIFHKDGLGALTLRRLGRELGVDATAMYRHFRNKAELVTALIDELFGELTEPDPERSWRDNLYNLMKAWWLIYRNNEGLAEAMAGQPDDEPRLFHLTEWAIRELRRAGIPDDELGLFYQAIYNHTVGSGLVAAFSPWLTSQDLRDEQRRKYGALNPAQFPNAAAAAQFIYPETQDAYLFSVSLLLDAIAARAARQPVGSTQTPSRTQ